MSQPSAAARLEGARAQLVAAQEHLKDLDTKEARSIESVEAFEAWHREHRSTSLEVERLTKVVNALEHDVVHERRQKLLSEAEAQLRTNEALAARMRTEGATIMQKIRALLNDLAQADTATARLNATLPAEIARIKSADTIARAREMRPREDISKRQIELWVGIENGTPIADQTSVTDLGNGIGTIPSASTAGMLKCARRRYRQVEYRPEEPVERVEPLFKVLRLPNFDGPGFAWNGDNIGSGQAALQLLERADQSGPKRQVLTELVPEGPWTTPISRPST